MQEALSKKSHTQSIHNYGDDNLQQLSESMLSLQQSLDNASMNGGIDTSNKQFHETHNMKSLAMNDDPYQQRSMSKTKVNMIKSTDFANA